MATIMIDTLRFANRLKKAGVEPKLAEAQAYAQAEMINELANTQLATKDDIKRLEQSTKDDINRLENDIKNLDAKTTNEFRLLRIEMSNLTSKLTIKLGGIMAIGLTAMVTINILMH